MGTIKKSSLFISSSIVFLLLLYTSSGALAQHPLNITVRNSTLISNKDVMPFWFHSNLNDIVEMDSPYLNLSEIEFHFSNSFQKEGNLKYAVGGNLAYGLAERNYVQANQLFGSLNFKRWVLEGGLFQNPIVYQGLSSTNGDFHWSNNVRPFPRLQFRTNDYIAFNFFPSWLSIKGLFEEGSLNDDNRYVKHTHLHRKNLFFKFQFNPLTNLNFGLEHMAMWGGIHPTLGELPVGFNNYLRYIMGLPGSEEFIPGDQSLMAGNQLAKYILQFQHTFQQGTIELYYNHPMTDRVDWGNYKDNLIGISYSRNKAFPFFSSVLYEFMYTNHQRVKKVGNEYFIPRGYEPYFQHGTYRSGLSYQNRILGTPLANVMVIQDGINLGTGNNRIILHHLGMNGYFNHYLKWKSFISYSTNLGAFNKAYDKVKPGFFDEKRKQINLLGELNYRFKNNRFTGKIALALDMGNLLENSTGMQLGFSYRIF